MILLAYGDILEQPVSNFQGIVPLYGEVLTPSETPREVCHENDLDILGIVWS